MSAGETWSTPFMKQCYVTAGVSLNMLSHGLVSGFPAILLPQLRAPDSIIQVDKTSESWIASITSITFIIGNLVISVMMDRLGRKKSNLISIAIMTAGWYITLWSSSVASIIVSRMIQGLSLGMTVQLCPIMIGEYTSPCNRGAFLATIHLALSGGILTTHTLGSLLRWQTTALICAIIMTIDLLMVCFTPETPIWLMAKGRYEESKATFRWLRGLNEEEELTRMIQDNVTAQTNRTKEHQHPLRILLNKFEYFRSSVVKEEFYKPSLIAIHLYILGQWGGTTILAQYTPDIFTYVVGDGIDAAKMTIILAVHRFISGICMTMIMERFKRRTMVITSTSLTVFSLLSIAGYAYARSRNLLSLDYPVIGIVLIHMHMVSICSGCLSLAFILMGEIFPLEYKGIAGGLSVMFISVNMFAVSKTGPYVLTETRIHMGYCIYAAISAYAMAILIILLPETRGRTLQDIEDEFRRRKPLDEAGTSVPLTN